MTSVAVYGQSGCLSSYSNLDVTVVAREIIQIIPEIEGSIYKSVQIIVSVEN